MPTFKLQLLRSDGTPAADALLAVAAAPADMPDLGLVADADGHVSIDGPPGAYAFSVWVDGRERRVQCELGTQAGVQEVALPG